MRNKNWFWGVIFILCALFVIAGQTGSFGQIDVISIAATILLAAICIQSLVYLNFFGTFVSIAFLYMIYQQPLGLTVISPWMLLTAAVLLSIGFNIIFHKRPHADHFDGKCGQFSRTSESIDDNNPYASVSFSDSAKYLHSDALRTAQFSVSFGALEVYFDQAKLSPEGAQVSIDCSFGSLKMYVPRDWMVVDNLKTSLGGVENKNRLAQPAEDSPKLTLTGNVSFGGVEIHYI